ncbi:hypothetical protein SAY86_001138 [Trapa natans]|uniref:Uncharacterized protein n=1 Tax=Trapa natans TaxID=22666 RepID=A0AAN7MBI6_TRANT|nr:hypothetical protein SAY86_001138 [Trapa natans]
MAKPMGPTGEFFKRRDKWRKRPMLMNQPRHATPDLGIAYLVGEHSDEHHHPTSLCLTDNEAQVSVAFLWHASHVSPLRISSRTLPKNHEVRPLSFSRQGKINLWSSPEASPSSI